MKKNFVRWVVAGVVLLVVFHVLIFAAPLERTPVFWLSYVFTLISIFSQIYIIRSAFFKGDSVRSRFYGFPIAKIGAAYLIAQFVLCFIFMLLAEAIALWIPLVLYITLLGVSCIGFVVTDATRDEIEKQDANLKRNTSIMRALQSKADTFLGIAGSAEITQELTALAEALRYSDPVSHESLQEIEMDLSACINEIERALADGEIEEAKIFCQKARTTLVERNRLCKLNKSLKN